MADIGGVDVSDRRTPIERFLSKVQRDPATGCWLWTAGLNRGGYAKFKADGRTWTGHRWAYEFYIGPVPDGLQLDHVKARGCRYLHCVNPAHLEPVTCRENLLRGETWQARNAAKTECPQGHPYDEANTYVNGNGGRRRCRACRHARYQRTGT